MSENSVIDVKKVRAMNCGDLCEFLRSQNMFQCVIDAIKEQDLDGESFAQLKEEDVKELGLWVKMGPRKRIMSLVDILGSVGTAVHNGSQLQPGEGNNSREPLTPIAIEENCNVPEIRGNVVLPSDLDAELDILDILKKDDEGRDVVQRFENNPLVKMSIKDRRCVVRLGVAHLIAVYGNHPPAHAKRKLAIAIVDGFQCLAFNVDNYPREYLYYNETATSYIQVRLNAIRKKQCESSRKRKVGAGGPKKKRTRRNKRPGNPPKKGPQIDETLQGKIAIMEDLPAVPANKTRILELAQDTFKVRNDQILAGEIDSATALFEQYPRFADCGCYLMWMEFKLMFPNSQPFDRFLEHYVPRILKMADQMNISEDVPDSCLKAILLMVQIHPFYKDMTADGKKSILGKLVLFKQPNIDLEAFCASKEEGFLPQLLITGAKDAPIDYYVVVDHTIIPAGNCALIALKTLISSYFVFNVHYPITLGPFYIFFEESILGIKKFTPSNGDFTSDLDSIYLDV